jgi:hypothetical protein
MLAYIIPFIFFGIFAQATIIPDNIKQQLVRLNATISDRSCSFYTEFEKLIPCGNNGYTLNFASHYCQVYLDAIDEFSDKAWQDATRRCLQMKLYEYAVKQQDYPLCKNLEEFGFDSHPKCYEKPDETRPQITFCKISFLDKMKIGWKAAGGPLMEILRSAAALNFCL